MASPTTATTRVDISFYTMPFNKFDSTYVKHRTYDTFHMKIVNFLSRLSEWHGCMLYMVVI